MPKFERLSKAEAEQLFKRRPPRLSIDLTEYTEFLKSLRVGDAGRIALQKDETSRVVKRRLTAAAKQMGKRLRYRKTDDEKLVLFRVVERKR